MASSSSKGGNAAEIDRLALALAKEPGSKAFIPLAEEYGKVGMWQEAAGVLEDGLKTYPNFITAMVALGRAYDQLNLPVKAQAILEEAVKLSPENLRAHRTLAKIYAAQGSKDVALRSCNVILSVNPQDQETLSLRAALVAPTATDRPEPASAKPVAAKAVEKPTEAAAPITESVAQPATIQHRNFAAETEESQQDHAQTATAAFNPSVGSHRKTATVNRLEQWLSSIQARRRDREQLRNPSAPTT